MKEREGSDGGSFNNKDDKSTSNVRGFKSNEVRKKRSAREGVGKKRISEMKQKEGKRKTGERR